MTKTPQVSPIHTFSSSLSIQMMDRHSAFMVLYQGDTNEIIYSMNEGKKVSQRELNLWRNFLRNSLRLFFTLKELLQ